MRTAIKIGVIVFFATTVAVFVIWDAPRNRVELMLERDAIEQAARAYFKAEMEHNYKQIYAHLAPSSTYRKTHTYEQYLQDVSASPVRIKSYKIMDIYRLRDNDNPREYPAVARLVQVEVDVALAFEDTGTQSTCNYCFTFLKEEGSWYKG
jgi:ribosomal protein L11 methylase PrmA